MLLIYNIGTTFFFIIQWFCPYWSQGEKVPNILIFGNFSTFSTFLTDG